MAFVRIEKLRTGQRSDFGIASVTMGAYLADGKTHSSKSIMFRITHTLIEQLGWKFDETNAIYVTINEGNGSDAGFLQLTAGGPDALARRVSRSKDKQRQGVSVAVSVDAMKHYVLNECPVPAQEVTHMIDAGALIIQCPDWLRYNPLSYQEPEVKKPTTVRPPMLEVVENDDSDATHLNRSQRRKLAKRVAGALR